MPYVREIRRVTPTRLEIQERADVIQFFAGMLFLVIGLALLATAVRVLLTTKEPSRSGLIALASWALPFTVVGGWTSLGRAWIVVDASRRSVTRTIGLVVPWRTRTYSFNEFCQVQLRVETFFGMRESVRNSEPPVRHEIRLARRGVRRAVPICTPLWWPGVYEDPAALAADIARLMGLPFKALSASGRP
jgi:hypothetical protein